MQRRGRDDRHILGIRAYRRAVDVGANGGVLAGVQNIVVGTHAQLLCFGKRVDDAERIKPHARLEIPLNTLHNHVMKC